MWKIADQEGAVIPINTKNWIKVSIQIKVCLYSQRQQVFAAAEKDSLE